MFLHVNKKLMLWMMVYSNFSPLFLTLCWGLQTNSKSSGPVPIPHSAWPDRFPAKEHCSRCGLCETTFVSEVTSSCAFIGDGMSRIDHMEEKVHGRRRKLNDEADSADELRFGVHEEPMMLAKGSVIGAQWTGVVTSIAISMLEANAVDAVVCIANESDANETKDDDDKVKNVSWSEPRPIIARNVEQVLKGKGVKPALAPSLAVLDEIKSDPSIKRLLFCGVGCAVQAFRAVQDKLGLDEVFVLGTNCADNSPTPEAARSFIEKGTKLDPSSVQGYEFMQVSFSFCVCKFDNLIK